MEFESFQTSIRTVDDKVETEKYERYFETMKSKLAGLLLATRAANWGQVLN